MTIYLSNRDGSGKTSEEGHYKLQTGILAGNSLGSGLIVTQNSPLGMSVIITSGQYKIDTTPSYSYTGWLSANETLSISAADPANPRITSIVLYVDKSATTSASPPNNPGITKLMAVNGTASGSPSAPSNPTIESAIGSGNPYIKLANIAVAAAATQITNANITDMRTGITLTSNLVNEAAILNSAVTTNKINDTAVTTAKIANDAVTTVKIANANVTDPKWRNGIAFYSYRNSTRNLALQTFTKFACDTISWNLNSNYSNSSDIGRFTATDAGIYSFTANLYAEQAVNTRAIIEIRKNGTANLGRVVDSTATSTRRLNGTVIYTLAPGDYVEAWAWTNVATNIASADTWFEGHLITRT